MMMTFSPTEITRKLKSFVFLLFEYLVQMGTISTFKEDKGLFLVLID
jgi:hypothetical protein